MHRDLPWPSARAARGLPATAALVTLGLALGATGCDEELVLDDALPRVTWVAVAPAVDVETPDGTRRVADVTVWVRDLEGDPVDLGVTWSAGGAATPITLAPGGHGLVGLTTRNGHLDPNGEAHLVRWDVTDVPDGPLTLRFTADDSETVGLDRSAADVEATAVTTPELTLPVGLPEPVAL